MQKKILFIGFLVMVLAGCATSTRYVNYTDQHFPPKDQNYTVNIYPDSQPISSANPYYVIGNVSIEGFNSSGVNPLTLSNQAKEIARKRGADAIINAKTVLYRSYADTMLRFTGELIVYAPASTK